MANDKKFDVKNGLYAQNVEFHSPNQANAIVASMSNSSNVLTIAGNVDITRNLTIDQTLVVDQGIQNTVIGNVTPTSAQFTTISVSSNATVNGLTINGSATIGSTLGVTGNVIAPNFIGNVVGNISGNIAAAGANTQVLFNDNNVIGATGQFTFDKSSNLLSVGGNVSTAGIASTGSGTFNSTLRASGGIQNTPIGNMTASTGQFTTVSATGNITGSALTANGSITAGTTFSAAGGIQNTIIGNVTPSSATFTTESVSGNSTINALTVNASATIGTTLRAAGGIQNTPIGNGTASTGQFTTVSATGNITGAALTSNGSITSGATLSATGGIQNTPIGNATASTGQFTTVSATGNITGAALTSNASITAATTLSAAGGIQNTPIGNVTPSSGLFTSLGTSGNLTVSGLTVNNSATVGTTLGVIGNATVGNLRTAGTVLITNTTNSTGANTGALIVQGGASFEKDVYVLGNIYATNVVAINANTLSVQDPLLYLTANTPFPYNYDIGIYSQFTGGPGNIYQHTGFVRDVDDGVWKLFSNVVPEPTITIDFTNATYDRIQTGGVTSLGSILGNSTAGFFGNTTVGALTVNASAIVGTTLQAQGGIQNTPIGNITASTGQFTTVSATGNVTGAALTANGSITAVTSLSALGGLQNTPIGNVTPNSAQFTTISTSGNATVNALTVNSSAVVGTTLQAISGIQNTPIGNVTASTGQFTTVSATGNVTGSALTSNNSITAGTTLQAQGGIQNTPIGNAAASTGQFTTISATGNVTGAALTSNGSITAVTSLSALGGIQNTIIGNVTPSSATFTSESVSGNSTVNALTVNASATVGTTLRASGGIQNTPIGNVTASTGQFTTVSATGNITGASLTSNGSITAGTTLSALGGIQNTIIGNVTPSSATFTSISVSANATVNQLTTNSSATVGGTLGVTGNYTGGGYVSATNQLIVNSNVSEGGQIVLAWPNIAGLTGQGNSTWNVDVDGTPDFRIFYQNAGGSTGVLLQANAANNTINLPGAGGVTATGNITAPNFIGNVVGNVSGNVVAAGANTQVQFNDNNITGASSQFTFNKASNLLTVGGNVNSNGLTVTGSGTFTTTLRASGGIQNTPIGNATASTGAFTSLTADTVAATNNGNGTNFKVGDDIWIGDINIANTLRLTGLQDGTQGYIVFGNSNSLSLGRSGTGALTYQGAFTAQGGITNTPIGNGTASTGQFTTVSATGNITGSSLTANSSITAGTTLQAAGGIQNTPIGNVTASTGQFTTVSATGNVTGAALTSNGSITAITTLSALGGLQNTPIGNGTASTGSFTTLTTTGNVTIADAIIHTNDTDTFIRFTANDTFAVTTSGSERYRITPNGNVLINTLSDNESRLVIAQNSATDRYGIYSSGAYVGTGPSGNVFGAYINAGISNNSGNVFGIYSTMPSTAAATTYAGYFLNPGQATQWSYGIYSQATQTDLNGPGRAFAGFFRVTSGSVGTTGRTYGVYVENTANTGVFAYGAYIETTNSNATTTIPLSVNHAGTELIRVVHTGNVGIRTSNPTSTFEVNGNLRANAGIQNTPIGNAIASTGQFTTLSATGNITGAALTSNGSITAVTSLSALGGIQNTPIGNVTASSGQFTTVSATANITGAALTSNGSITAVTTLSALGGVQNTPIGNGTASTGAFTTISASGNLTIADAIVHTSDADTFIRFPANDTFSVTTNGSDRIYVDSTGNVGFGTTSPNAKVIIVDTVLANSGNLVGSALTVNQNWNTTGNVTAIKLNVSNVASGSNSLLMDLQIGGSSIVSTNKNGLIFGTSGVGIGWAPNAVRLVAGNGNSLYINRAGTASFSELATFYDAGASTSYLNLYSLAEYRIGDDTILARDSGNVFAQRNGLGAQTLRIYNTYTDASNYERATIGWAGNILSIGAEAAGSGTARMTRFISNVSGVSTGWEFRSNASTAPRLVLAGTDRSATLAGEYQNMLQSVDGGFWSAFNYAAGGSSKVAFRHTNQNATISYFGLDGSAASVMQLNTGTGKGDGYGAALELWQMTAPAATAANGIRVYAENGGSSNAQISFLYSGSETFKFIQNGTIRFGNTTSSAPALKRNGSSLEVRLADDSGFANLTVGNLLVDRSIIGNSALTILGGIQNTPIGNATASTGQFTTLNATSLSTTGNITGAALTSNASITAVNTLSALGGIQNTPIGNVTASTGQFTTVSATGNITGAALTSNASITAVTTLSALGGIQNTPIGNVTASTGQFTTVSATGNVTGNALTATNSITAGTTLSAQGGIQNTPIGNGTPNSGKFTTLETTGAATLSSLTANAASIFYSNLTVTGNLVVSGNIITTGSNNVAFTDSIIELHVLPNLANLTFDDGKDIGLRFHYFKTDSQNAFLGWENSTGYLEWLGAGVNETANSNVASGATYGTFKTGEFIADNSTISTSSITGAIRTNGGIGALGNVFVGGLIDADGGLQATPIGNLTPSTAQFTTVSSSGNITASALTVNASLTVGTSLRAAGGIQNTPIGNVTASTGQFTTVSATGNITGSALTANGSITSGNTLQAVGGIQNTVIGNVSPSSAQFTTINSSGNTTVSALTVNNNATINGALGVTGSLVVNAANISANLLVNNITVSSYVNSNLIPSANNVYSLGSTDFRWKDLYLTGNTLFLGEATLSSSQNDFIVSGNLISVQVLANIIGNAGTSFVGSTLNASSNATVQGLTVNASATVGTTLQVLGGIQNTIIGNVTPSSANFTNINGSGNLTVQALTVNGTGSFGTSLTVSGGIQNTPIGNVTASSGQFTTVSATGNITGSSVTSNASITAVTTLSALGGVQNTPIGNVTASTGQFTTVSATGNITGAALTSNASITAITSLSALGGIQNTPIGNVTPSTAIFTSETVSGNSTINALTVNNSATVGTTFRAAGGIQNTPIGNGTASTGQFTTLSATGNITGAALTSNASITAVTTLSALGGLQNTPIGNVTASSGQFTTVSATGNITGAALTANGSIVAGTTLRAVAGIQNTPIGNVTASTGAFTTLSTTGNITIADAIIHENDTNTFFRFLANDTIVITTSGSEAIRVDSSGNVGINTNVPTYKLQVNGSFAATTKSFVIPHPSKPNHTLVYGSLEGPENGVYVRGKLQGHNIIQLPDYWKELVDENTVTVQLTPIGKFQKLYVEEIANNQVKINTGGITKSVISCFYTVFAERKDVGKLQVEVQG